MREDELDVVEPLAAAPVLHDGGPSVARVAEAVGEDDRGRVPRGRWHYEAGLPGGRHGGERVCWCKKRQAGGTYVGRRGSGGSVTVVAELVAAALEAALFITTLLVFVEAGRGGTLDLWCRSS